MSVNKSLVLALCIAVTGCAQTPKTDSASAAGPWYWPFSSEATADASPQEAAGKAAQKPEVKPAPAVAAKSESDSKWYWPFGSDATADAKAQPSADKAAQKPEAKPAPALVAKSETDSKWWWPFGASNSADTPQAAKALPMPDPKITQAWLDEYEPRVRLAIKDSNFQVERREDLLIVTAPVDGSFNPDRPAMLLPVSLGPITRLAKAVEADPKTAVLILGHADTTGAAAANQKISQERAQSISAIFRLSGLERNRLSNRGMGAVMPRAANDSPQGRALNRRVEILLTPQDTMRALMSRYEVPAVAPTMVAVQDAKPAAPAPAAKKAAPAKKETAKKATVAKKAATPAKKAPAKKAEPAKKSNTQASN
ncbi:OmpA family protein [Pseudomonas ovata]|uniref:OmpA family protein n=1 Tax=Pseudomonas ovata TaxID=1839709 RepID=UPI000D686685|nr:OmpA family protein [Pseudomonas ovata]